MTLQAGQVLHDRYRIDALLGEGGMGAVYRAWDLSVSVRVVVKENRVHSEEAQRQFRREAAILANLRHPNLPRVTDHFLIPGEGQYLVMDYIEGQDLRQIVQRYGQVSEAQALDWIDQVLDALEYLHTHEQRVIHRDVKPANIKITPGGQVYLVDFGLAKLQSHAQETTTGARGVTPGYAPPEQYGHARTDARTDVYSVGATLYAILTGNTPPDALVLVTGEAELPGIRQYSPAVSPAVEAAVLQAMETRPTDRFQSASTFRAALAGQRSGGKAQSTVESPAGPMPGAGAKPGTPRPRAAIWILALGAVVVLAAAIIAASGLLSARGDSETAGLTELTETASAGLSATVTPSPSSIPPSSTPEVSATFAAPTLTPAPAPSETPLPSNVYIEYVLDASNSMMESLSGDRAKVDAAGAALAEHWQSLPGRANVGLRAFGHRYPAVDENSCLDTELLAPVSPANPELLVRQVDGIRARGMSPLSEVLVQASGDFTYTEGRVNALILIADGSDNCAGSPCQVVRTHWEVGIRCPIHVVGLAVSEDARKDLTCIAGVSGGSYQDAASQGEVLRALGGLVSTITANGP